MSRPRLIFMGTPEFAVPALECLARRTDIELALVVTQPDRPAGRGRRLTPPPVKVAASERNLPILQTSTLRDPAVRERIIGIKPDLIVVAAFGMILGRWILDLPRHGCVNLHASLLPSYRGANPIATAILEGDQKTGVSLMRMERGLDTGPVYATAALQIDSQDTTVTLTSRLADLAGQLIDTRVDDLLNDRIEPQPQPLGATLTRPLVKADGWLDWTMDANRLARQVRAMWPWPRAWTTLPTGDALQVHAARPCETIEGSRQPGELVRRGGRTLVTCGDGTFELARIQLAGGKPLEAAAIAHHPALPDGTILGQSGHPGPTPPLVVPADEAR
ncbi:MAG TPA: methionyl-tRNA formyltransferase [Thermomicrobiales bacterium]|nr:methionyl-tRNA formyltransferase [Thermomicrobiales bacterium]